VLIANRNKARAEALAAAVPGRAAVVDWEELQSGAVSADVLANSTSVGMVPNVEETPVATAAVGNVSWWFKRSNIQNGSVVSVHPAIMLQRLSATLHMIQHNSCSSYANHLLCRPIFCFPCCCLQFKVVFDAVYTPRETRLLRDAAAAGCLMADGVAMFVGQAVEQLKLFTGTSQPPVQLMEDVVLGKVKVGSS
jgi:shikimate 5-dehydrogenase